MPVKINVLVAWVKPLSLIHILRCCDDSIANSNVNKSNAASKRSHAISVQKLCGKDNSVPKKLIRVPHIIGCRTALGGNDISLGCLNHTTIYQWMSAFLKTMFFVELWSLWRQALSVSKKRRLPQNILGMRQHDAISWHGLLCHQGFIYIPLKADKNNFHTWGWATLKQIGFLGHWGRCPLNFQNLKGPT